MRRSGLVSLLVLVSLAAGCAGGTPGPSPTPAPTSATPAPSSPTPVPSSNPAPEPIDVARVDLPRAPATDEDATSAADAINAFAFDLHRALAKRDKNLVFSPTSIAIALGMARAGARGETAAQMDKVLRNVASNENANWLNALDQALASRSGTFSDAEGAPHELTLDITNAYFAQRDFAFLSAFLEALATRFGAGVHLVDFVEDSEGARRLINAWAKERTRDRIPEVLLPPDITPDTRLALVNAIYLKAPWHQPFLDQMTSTDPFTRLDGSTVDVPMMHNALHGISCGTGRGWGAMDLPYLNGSLSMLVIVPDDLTAFEASLDAGVLETIDRAFPDEGVPKVSLPKFDFETREGLVQILADLGMPNAFDERADFSGMSAQARLAISKVIHQANISVDEKGTEAAAVTVVSIDVSGPPPATCTVDANRPFIFAIRDRETGAILFLGHVVDPS